MDSDAFRKSNCNVRQEVTAERQIFFANVEQSRGGCNFDRRPAAPNGGGRLRPSMESGF
jgi:hypothetical protein